MSRLSFGTTALAILAACEVMARKLWPELFVAAPPCAQGEDDVDEMAVW